MASSEKLKGRPTFSEGSARYFLTASDENQKLMLPRFFFYQHKFLIEPLMIYVIFSPPSAAWKYREGGTAGFAKRRPHGRSRDNAKHAKRSELNITYEVMLLLNILRPLFNVAVANGRLWQRKIAVCESEGSIEVSLYLPTRIPSKMRFAKVRIGVEGRRDSSRRFFTKLNFYSELGNRALSLIKKFLKQERYTSKKAGTPIDFLMTIKVPSLILSVYTCSCWMFLIFLLRNHFSSIGQSRSRRAVCLNNRGDFKDGDW